MKRFNNDTVMPWTFLLLSLLTVGSGCRHKPPPSAYLAPYASQLEVSNHPYNNEKWTRNYEQLQQDEPARAHAHRLSAAVERLRAGDTEAAIEELELLLSELAERNKPYEADLRHQTRRYIALAYLRLGEQENCIHHHAHASCILPIASPAVHQRQRGSTGAVEQYRQLLRDDPGDFESRYLLNLAYMTLGQYPEQVPGEYLVRHPLFEAPPANWVRDVAMEKGLAATGLAGGVIAEDFNRDGRPDLVISSWDMQTGLQFFQNDRGISWTDCSTASGLSGINGGLNLTQTDYNNDGWADIFVLRGGWLGRYGCIPNTLLRNDGPGPAGTVTFTDVTEETGLLTAHPTQTAVWADFNNDGRLDVFIGNESAVTGQVHPSQLFLNNRDDTFTEVGPEAGVALADAPGGRQYIIKGVTAADYDRDGWTDLYVSTRDDRNFLFRNQGLTPEGIPRFEDATEAAGLGGQYKTFSCWFWDYDNDGWEDILAAGFHSPEFYAGRSIAHDFCRELLGLEHEAQTGLLFRNNGDGTFRDVTAAEGLDKILYMMGGNFGDFDNDGWLDFYCGNGDPDLRAVIPNRMFRGTGAGFEEITNAGFGHIQKGHGTAFADFDGDGDQDIYMVVGGFYQGDVYQNVLLENQYDAPNNFIAIRLEGTHSNALGVGSRLRLSIREAAATREVYRSVNPGGSFGASSFTQHIGVGQAATVDTLEIIWAGSGTRQVLTGLAVNQLHTVRESSTPSRRLREQ
jgi:hypothetical protein